MGTSLDIDITQLQEGGEEDTREEEEEREGWDVEMFVLLSAQTLLRSWRVWSRVAWSWTFSSFAWATRSAAHRVWSVKRTLERDHKNEWRLTKECCKVIIKLVNMKRSKTGGLPYQSSPFSQLQDTYFHNHFFHCEYFSEVDIPMQTLTWLMASAPCSLPFILTFSRATAPLSLFSGFTK